MGKIAHFLAASLLLFATEDLSNDLIRIKDRYRIPGVALATIKEGKIETHCIGYANSDLQRKIVRDSIFQAASLSKPVTAWAVLNLAEQGKIELNAPIEKYLTRWRFSPSRYPSKNVTIRRILDHTSGLSVPSYPGYLSPDFLPTLEETLKGIKGSHGPLEISSSPGETFQYSGGGYTLLQLLIEEVSGASFQKYMLQEVFFPLQLAHTSFALDESQKDKLCTSYNVLGRPIEPVYFAEQAAAGMYTSIDDLATFASHILMSYHDSLPIAKQICSGLGFEVEYLDADTPLAYHFGANPGWRTAMFLLPTHNSGMVILTNSDRGASMIHDLSSQWIEKQTKLSPAFYQEILQERKVIHLLIGLFAALFSYFFIKNWKRKKENFRWSILIAVLWCWFFYAKNPFLQGWVISSFLPSDFEWITMLIILWNIVNIFIKFRHQM